MASDLDRVLRAVDALAGELVSFTADLIAIPTVNPPGEAYEPCARHIGDTLRGFGFETQYYTADGLPEHRPDYPRVNVVGVRRGTAGAALRAPERAPRRRAGRRRLDGGAVRPHRARRPHLRARGART